MDDRERSKPHSTSSRTHPAVPACTPCCATPLHKQAGGDSGGSLPHTCGRHGWVGGAPGDRLDEVDCRRGLAGGLVEHSAAGSRALRLHLLGAHSNRAGALLAELGNGRGAGESAGSAQSSGHVLASTGTSEEGVWRI